MRPKKINSKCSLCVLLVVLVSSLLGSRQNVFGLPIRQKNNTDTLKGRPTPDKALLAKFQLLCQKMSNVKGSYTLAGIINIIDHANPAEKMENVKFLFCKNGDNFYYRLGTTATINQQGVYLFIDYATKRIMVSQKKQVNYDNGLKAFGDMGASIQSENYKLVSKVNGNEQTLSLINEFHISCKQYSITFNKQDLMIKRLYMRLSNFNKPLRTDNEKVVDISISEWSNAADLTKYPQKDEVVKYANGGWIAVNGFKNYQLVNM